VVEQLRQLENVLREICRLGGGDALVHDVRGFRRGQPEFPDFIGGFVREVLGKF